MGEARTGQPSAANIRHDSTSPDEVRSYWERQFLKRSFNPLESPAATENLRAQVEEWKKQGKTVVFTSGVYDLFHANHRTYLFHTKIAAAPYCWRKFNNYPTTPAWEELPETEQSIFTESLLRDDLLRLVVSVDGNQAVARRKGHKPEKGGTDRPVYDWSTRSRDVLSAALQLGSGRPVMVADAVTIHDCEQPALANSPHSGIMEIARYVSPDVWSIYFESEDIVEALRTTHADDFADVETVLLTGNNFYHDELIGGPFTTTNITRRLGGTSLMNGGV